MILKPFALSEALNIPNLDPRLLAIAEKVQNKQRISEEEGLLLFEKGELGL